MREPLTEGLVAATLRFGCAVLAVDRLATDSRAGSGVAADGLATGCAGATLADAAAAAGFVLVTCTLAAGFVDATAGLVAVLVRLAGTARADCWAITEDEQTPTVRSTVAIRNGVKRVVMSVFLTG